MSLKQRDCGTKGAMYFCIIVGIELWESVYIFSCFILLLLEFLFSIKKK